MNLDSFFQCVFLPITCSLLSFIQTLSLSQLLFTIQGSHKKFIAYQISKPISKYFVINKLPKILKYSQSLLTVSKCPKVVFGDMALPGLVTLCQCFAETPCLNVPPCGLKDKDSPEKLLQPTKVHDVISRKTTKVI